MKLLLWACIFYVAFAKKRFHFPDEKIFLSDEKDYSGNHYPLNPSLNIPYPTSANNFAPPFHPSGNEIPNYRGNPDPNSGGPALPWILSSPGALLYHRSSLPVTTWLASSSPPTPPQKSPFFALPSSSLGGPFLPDSAPMPKPAEPYIATPLVAVPTTPPNPKLIAVEPGPLEPDDAEPVASEHQPATSLD
ncbi:proline-rich protein 27 [Mustela putorius furo]|uniref:Proline-rich protein 27 n=1 Tax=Mustela putorius furo TaxID=9669 RepID=A0A8U0V2S2_MUSPF|nr:proline-rich protein 27 [Mustela putorius furo]